jgi:hypothetical protein
LQYDFEDKEVVSALQVRRFTIIGFAIAIQQLTIFLLRLEHIEFAATTCATRIGVVKLTADK